VATSRLHLIDMSDYNPGVRLYWWTTVSAGLAVTAWSIDRFARMDSTAQLIVAALMVLVILSSLKSTYVPGTQVVISPGDVFVFLAAILHGPAAATLVAVAEALCGSFRKSQRWTSRLGGPALMAIAISSSAGLFALSVDWLRENGLLGSATLMAALLAFSFIYFLLNTILLAAHQSLKLRRGLFSLWKENYSWAGLTYVASAATAGLVQLAILQIGMAALLAAIPLIAVISATSHLYFKQAEERLRGAERMRLILNNTSDVVFAFNLKGRITYVNPAIESLTGYAIQEISEFEFLSLVHPDDKLRLSIVWDLLVAGQRRSEEEFRLETRNGKTKWCSGSWGPIYDERGQQIGIQGNLRDISEHKTLQAQLLHSQKMEAIGRLAGGVAHDFNNLVSAIIGYCQLSLGQLDNGSLAHQQIQEVLKTARRAGVLTRQLMAFSRRQVLVPKVVDLNALVDDTSEMLRRLIGEQTELISSFSPQLWSVRADPGQIGQVIVNLAVNARDAMPNGGSITIQTGNVLVSQAEVGHKATLAPGEYVTLSVTDTGSGIDAETMSQMFEPFFTTKAMGKGTGLGLSTVYGIVKQSGGEITVESELGKGTTFRIYLPREDAPQTLSLESIVPPAHCGTETILIVEDDETMLELTWQILSDAGYNALRTPGGHSAILECERYEGTIHLMITDLVMPEMNGPELAQRVALLRPEMKILLMSGYAGDATGAISVAGIPFIQKPFTPQALWRKVREVLDSGQSLSAGNSRSA
jgi:PAS domain S-box-containing protein